MKRICSLILLMTLVLQGRAQKEKELTIEECYSLARQHYPLIRQYELISKSREYSLQNASKGYLPQVSLNAQATYQSEVTEVPIHIPGMSLPELSKDQYKLYADVNQTLYDGGAIRLQKQSLEANAAVEEQRLEVELYKLNERINQLFFGILLIKEQLVQNELLIKDIQLGIDKAQSRVDNGTAVKSTVDVLKAEKLKAGQRATELRSADKAYRSMLEQFTGQQVSENTVLIRPAEPDISGTIARPELSLFDRQAQTLDIQKKMIDSRSLPKFNMFVQGGYGRPGLNMLSNEFSPYAIGGLRMNWVFGGLYTAGKERKIIENNRSNINLQRETFLFNTELSLKQQSEEVRKLSELTTSDGEIIDLRNSIKNTASIQLENGIINTSDYLREVNAEDQARQQLLLHQMQKLIATYNQQNTTGK
jgi:outer membrane protein TolC